jgi:hypothetical protein
MDVDTSRRKEDSSCATDRAERREEVRKGDLLSGDVIRN